MRAALRIRSSDAFCFCCVIANYALSLPRGDDRRSTSRVLIHHAGGKGEGKRAETRVERFQLQTGRNDRVIRYQVVHASAIDGHKGTAVLGLDVATRTLPLAQDDFDARGLT